MVDNIIRAISQRVQGWVYVLGYMGSACRGLA